RREGVKQRSKRLVGIFYISAAVFGLGSPFQHILPEFVRDAPVGPLYEFIVCRGDRVAVLIHPQTESDILPECPHVALSDTVLNERRNLVERSPGDSVLRDVNRP